MDQIAELRDAYGVVPYELPAEDEPAGNAFHLLGAFKETARMVGWPQDAIRTVMEEATRRDYDHLRGVLAQVVD